MTVGDVIDRTPAEGELTRTKALLEATFAATTDGIVVVDAVGSVVGFNERFAQMWRLPTSLVAEWTDSRLLACMLDQVREPSDFVHRIEDLRVDPVAESVDVLALKDGRVFERYSRPQRVRNQLVGRVWSYRDVTDRIRAREELRLLRTLAIALRKAGDMASMLRVVLDAVCEATGWAVGQAWLPTEDGTALVCAPVWAHATEDLAPFRERSLRTRFLPRFGLPGRVWASGVPEWIPDLHPDVPFFRADVAREVGLRAALAVPVFAQGEVVAVLEFLEHDAGEVDDRHIDLLSAVAAQLGSCVERTRGEAALRESEARYRVLVEHAPEAILLFDPDRARFVSVNENAVGLFGWPRDRLLSLGPLDVSPPTQPGGRPSADAARDWLQVATESGVAVFEWVGRTATGREFPCEVRLVSLPDAGLPLLRASVTDITGRKQAEALRIGQSRVLEMVATGAPLADTLTNLVHLFESQSPGMIGSVLLLDRDGRHLRHGAAPGLPDAYNRAIEGESIGPHAGSCGTAAYRKEAVIVSDIQTDPLWADYRDLAARSGLRACWSTPIRSYTGEVLGTFAMYYREPRVPGPDDTRVIGIATHLAGIAIERRRAEEAVQRSKEELQSLMVSVSDALWSGEFDAEGRWTLRYCSPVIEKITGRPPEFYAEGPARWLETVHPDDRARMAASHLRLRSGASGKEEGDYRVVLPDGAIRWVRDSTRATWSNGALRVDGVISDISERKQAEEELQLYRSHLEELVAARTRKLDDLNQELEAFCYSVSHDLRAPLRSIDGFSQILLEDYGSGLDTRGREHLARIRASSRRMADLIDDLLNLSRVSRGDLRMQRVDLTALARKAAELLRETAPERDVDFVIEEGVTGRGDPQLLGVVLDNLLGNAWKFTAKHPRARIEFGRAQRDGRGVYFVRDDGAGFDMAYVDKLFGAFQRLHSTSEFEGTGIGLATVQRVVHRHGGRVWAEGAVERGATFYFTLEG